MSFNTAVWNLAFQVLQFVLMGCIGFYVYMSNKDKVTNDRITQMEQDFNKRLSDISKEMDSKLDRDAERIAKIEAKAEMAPTHQDFGDVHDKINDVAECAKRTEGTVTAIQQQLQLINEHLLRGGK